MNQPLRLVQERIATAARRSGRQPDEIRLIAVSKKQPVQGIQQLAAQGQTDFAESTLQEAQEKIPQCPALRWHCIGHIQSNKTRHIPGLFGWVHSVDSKKLVSRLQQAASQQDNPLKFLLQVNIAEDPAKFGFAPQHLNAVIESILDKQYSHVTLQGLMTIGRANATQDETRRTFAALKTLSGELSKRFGQDCFKEISMGMSRDFEMAIEEGATMVRVGTALFVEN